MRGRLDIIANILTIAEKDVLESHIMLKCSLSPKQFDEYIQMLLETGLIDAFPVVNLRHMSEPKNRRRMIFHTSKTGNQFLKLYSELYTLVNKCATISCGKGMDIFRVLRKAVSLFSYRRQDGHVPTEKVILHER